MTYASLLRYRAKCVATMWSAPYTMKRRSQAAARLCYLLASPNNDLAQDLSNGNFS